MDIMYIDKPCGSVLSDIICLWSDAFGDGEEYIKNFMDSPFWRGCVAMADCGKIVSAVHLTCPTENEGFIYGYAVATLREYRGRGLCRRLHESIFAACREKYAVYGVHPASGELVSFYRSMDMEPSSYRYFSTVEGDGGVLCPISHREYCDMRRMYLGTLSPHWLEAGEYETVGFDLDGVWCAACMSGGKIWELLAPPELEGAAARRAATMYGRAELAALCDSPVASECALMTYNGEERNFSLFIE